MKKTILLPIMTGLLYLASCENKFAIKQEAKLLDKGPTFSLYKESPEVSILDTVSKEPPYMGINKPQPLIIEELPKSYIDRKFIKGLAGMTYDLYLIPGNIVEYNEIDSTYEFKTLKGIIKNDSLPKAETIIDGINYSSKINSGASFNGSFIIGGLKVERNKIMELIIQDVSKSYVPPSLIDIEAIKNVMKKIPENERKNYFYIKTATLTFINNRKYSETKFNANINTVYVTAEGKAYSTNDKFSRERLISVDLTSLDNLLTN